MSGFSTTEVSNNRKDATGYCDTRPVIFFDIDNCLYSRKCNVHDMMQKYIDKFFVKHLSHKPGYTKTLHNDYYRQYGLAIRGLAIEHNIDAMQFNREVDDALPLDDALKPDPELRRFLQSFDQRKVKLWLLTNAYRTHAERVLKLLQVDDLFEGLTFCDYQKPNFACKPEAAMYAAAEADAGVSNVDQCYFVDDSALNCAHAEERGWHAVHFVEPAVAPPQSPECKYRISKFDELRDIFPQFFKDSTNTPL